LQFSKIQPDIKEPDSDDEKKNDLLDGNEAVEKDLEECRDSFLLEIIGYYRYALEKIYCHKNDKAI